MKQLAFILIISFQLFSANLFSQGFPQTYTRTSTSMEYIGASVSDGNGGVIVTGSSYDVNDNSWDLVTIKYSSSGGVTWTETYASTNSIYPTSMAIDPSGNIYITGTQNGDVFTISYSSGGTQRWVSNYDGGNNDYATGIALDDQGYVYVTGYSYISHSYGSSNYDMIVIAYNTSNGHLKSGWTNNPVLFDLDDQDVAYHGSFYGHGDDYAFGITVFNNISGNTHTPPAIFICGKSLFNPYYIPHGGDTTRYSNAYMTVQFNTSDGTRTGYTFYKIDYPNIDGDACALAITVSQLTGNTYSTGYKPKDDSPTGSHSVDCITMQNHYGFACTECEDWCSSWVDASGDSCVPSMTDHGYDQGTSIAIIDSSDKTQIQIFVAGYTTTNSSGGATKGYDYLVLKYYGTNGNPSCSAEHYPPTNVFTFDGPGHGNDKAYSICTDPNNHVWVTGSSYTGSSSGCYDIVTLNLANNLGSPTSYTFDGSENIGDVGNQVISSGSYIYTSGTTNLGCNINVHSDYVTLQYNSSSDNSNLSALSNTNSGIPKTFGLSQNYPNPFNPTTVINYAIPKASYVSLKIYNILGQSVMNIPSKYVDAGYYSEVIDASAMASGVYFYVIDVKDAINQAILYSAARKMLLIK